MKDELNYKDFYYDKRESPVDAPVSIGAERSRSKSEDFYSEEIDLKKPASVITNGRFFAWGGWVLSTLLFIVLILGSGGSEVKGVAEKTLATIFGAGGSEHLVESIDLNSPRNKTKNNTTTVSVDKEKDGVSAPVYKPKEKININIAELAELDEIIGVGPATAQKIIEYRNTIGIFRKIEDIKNVAGIGEVTFEKMKMQITVGIVTPLPDPTPPPLTLPSPIPPVTATAPVSPVPPTPVPAPQPPVPPAPQPIQGKININTADQEELDKITGVGPATAQKIIDYRESISPFYKIEDIKKVNGIKDATFLKMKDQITVGNAKPPIPPPAPDPVPPTPPAPIPPPAPEPAPVPPQPSPEPAPPAPNPPAPEPTPPASEPQSPPPPPSPTPAVPPSEPPPAPPEPAPPPPEPVPPEPNPEPVPPPSSPVIEHLLISEIMAGNDENSNNEFIELYNPTENIIDLTGWSIKKKTSTPGAEYATFIPASKFVGKSIPPGKYFLAANTTYASLPADVFWAASNTLAYTSNSIAAYDASGVSTDSVSWENIPKNQSLVRDSWDSSEYHIDSAPTPTNSQN